jgi:antitoxin component YwqK of YwqJK toxin-antitoxin module
MILLYIHLHVVKYILNLYLDYENDVPKLEQIIGKDFKFDITPHEKEKIEYYMKKIININGKKTNKLIPTRSIQFKRTYIDEILVRTEDFYESFNLDKTGNKHSIINYKNNLEHGKYIIWYENGNLSLMEEYENGMRNGISIQFFDNGHINMIKFYKDDKESSTLFEFCSAGKNHGKLEKYKICESRNEYNTIQI